MEDEEKLQSILHKFKSLTENLIDNLKKENYDSLDFIIEERNILLDKLINEKYTKEDIFHLIKELKIQELNNELMGLLQINMNKIKENLEYVSRSKAANNMYNNVYLKGAKIFNKKV